MEYKEAVRYLKLVREGTENDNIGQLQKCVYDTSIEALEKRIPKKPIGKYTDYKCPVCSRRVRSGKGSSSRGVDYYCQRCGQAMDWSDRNE